MRTKPILKSGGTGAGVPGSDGRSGYSGLSGYSGAIGPEFIPQIAKSLFVDGNRTDTYTATGTNTKPFKTIQEAINQIITNNDNTINPYNIEIMNGKYYETITLEDLKLYRIKLSGNGIVQIRPTTNQSFKSITNNTNLTMLHLKGITFLAPFVITGANASTAFNDVIWDDCNFVAGDGSQVADITLTCINNVTIRRSYIDINSITYNNVNYSIIDDTNIGAMFNITMDSTTNLPSQGKNGSVIINNSMLMGAPIFTKGGTAALQFITNGSTLLAGMSTGTVTIPSGVTVSAYSSFYRGTWTNNSVLNLRNSFVAVLLGTAPVLTQQLASQIGNSVTVSTGILPPTTTPSRVGDMFVDTTGKKIYISTGIVNSGDWTIIN